MISAAKATKSVLSASGRKNQLSQQLARSFTSTRANLDGELASVCHENLVHSPFDSIPHEAHEPVPEFLMAAWKGKGGFLGPETAIIDGTTDMRRTYDEYYADTTGLAGTLKYDLGLQEGCCVCLFTANHVDYLPINLAVGLTGAKLTPVNPLYKQNELEHVLANSQSSVLIADPQNLEIAVAAAKNSPTVKHVVVLAEDNAASPMAGIPTLESLKRHDLAFDTSIAEMHPDKDEHPFLLPYSSGTTGVPKGVCLSHANVVANIQQIDATEGLHFEVGEKLISPLPFFHIYGLCVSSMYCAWRGNTLITISGRFDLDHFLGMMKEHKPERAHLVPPILVKLAKDPKVLDCDFSNLRTVLSAAAPLGQEVEEAIVERLGCDIKQGWGMSELSPIATMSRDPEGKPGSVGALVPDTQAKIIDLEGKSLGPHEEGELCIKGPQVMMGYYGAKDKTDETVSECGWLRTGDIAYYDDDGYFYITDRLKELIKVRGFQVAPAELEALLLSNDAVKDAAVIQIPDENSGELPRAYIVLQPGEEATEEKKDEIYQWVKEKVAPYKRLDGGIVFFDEVPKSGTGKILRRLLRDQLKEEMAA